MKLKYVYPINSPKMLNIINTNFNIDQILNNIHTMNINNRYFMISINNGNIFEITSYTYNEIERYKLNLKINKKIIEEIESLFKHGLFEDYIKKENDRITNLCLVLTHKCNLNCLYCFAQGGGYGNNNMPNMSFEIAKRNIDCYFESNKEYNDEIMIQFFGGEPLLNWDCIDNIISYCKEKSKYFKFKVSYKLITNGTVFNKNIAYKLKYDDVNIRISLDGNKSRNDQFRKYKNSGYSVYDKIIKNIFEFQLNPNNIEVVMTYAYQEADLCDSIKELFNKGFHIFSINSLVNTPTFKNKFYENIYNEFLELADLVFEHNRKNEFIFIDFFSKNLRNIFKQDNLNLFKSCAGTTRSLTVDADGLAYPCDLFMCNKEDSLGVISDFNQLKENKFLKRMNDEGMFNYCQQCWFKSMCNGMCSYKLFYDKENVILDCKIKKLKFKASIYLLTKLVPTIKDYPYYNEWRNV